MVRLVLWGGTGHARVIAAALQDSSVEIEAVFDRNDVVPPLHGVPVYVGRDKFKAWLSTRNGEPLHHAIAIGGARGRDRLEIAAWLDGLGITPFTVVHRAAIVEPGATFAEGSQILAGAVLCANARIGHQTIVNTRASIDHDSIAGDGVHIGPGATVCGEVEIGSGVFIGAGATVLPRIRIGNDAIIGAGAVVTRDVGSGSVVAGVPARPLVRGAAS